MNKILIVDDDEAILAMLKFKLLKEKYEVRTAENGEVGKRVVLDFKPDLIVTDLMMPVVSGLDLIKYLRLDLGLDVPIVMLSSTGQEKIVLQAFEMGANDYMTKPFSSNELMDRIKTLLTRSYV